MDDARRQEFKDIFAKKSTNTFTSVFKQVCDLYDNGCMTEEQFDEFAWCAYGTGDIGKAVDNMNKAIDHSIETGKNCTFTQNNGLLEFGDLKKPLESHLKTWNVTVVSVNKLTP